MIRLLRIKNITNLQKQDGPISLEINSFPEWIEGDVKIKIE
jgi:hypothetical protein